MNSGGSSSSRIKHQTVLTDEMRNHLIDECELSLSRSKTNEQTNKTRKDKNQRQNPEETVVYWEK